MPFLDHLYTVNIEPNERGYVSGREKRLTQILRYQWPRKGSIFTCPVGTISNGASVPGIVLPIIVDNTGKIDKPAWPHDLLFDVYLRWPKARREAWEAENDVWTKAEADLQFRDSMLDENMYPLRANGAYVGVRLNLRAQYNWGKDRKFLSYETYDDSMFDDD